MDGGDFKEQLDKDIAYAKSSPYEIRVECDEGLGSITSIALLSQKVTDQFNVEFKIASGVQFVGWKAYSKSSDGTYNEISEDYIKFLSYNTESNDGIYKASVKFVKGIQGIVIKPYCFLLPKVTSITPEFSAAGVDQDSIIKITFNKPVNPESFGDFSCLSLYSAEGNLSEYFDTPYFSSDNTVLCISPREKDENDNLIHILTPDSGKKLDISVSIDFTNVKDVDGLSISQNEAHTYRIKDTYGNQEKVKFLVKTVEGTGTFLSDGEKECTVGYSVDLQFTANKSDYKFIGLEAVSSSDGSPRGDVVSVRTLESDPDTGIYKVRVTIMEKVDDILIQPACQLLPKVVEILPKKESAGCSQDSSITITFNKPVDTSFFKDFSNISIKGDDGISLTSYFERPSFSNDGTVLTIPTVKGKFLLDKDNTPVGTTKAVIVTLNLTGAKDTDGLEIAPFAAHTYLVNKDVDKKPPLLSEALIFSTRDTSDYFYRELTDKPFYKEDGVNENWKQADFNKNHVSSIYLTVSGSDKESGIQKVRVKEIYERNNRNQEVESKTETEKYYYDFTSKQDESGETIYTFEIEHEFRSTEDGLYRIELSVFDNAGNESEKKVYYAVKDTVLDIKDRLNIGNKAVFPEYNSATGKYESDLGLTALNLMPQQFSFNHNSEVFITIEVYQDGESGTKIIDNDRSKDAVIYTTEIQNYFSAHKADPAKNTYFKISCRCETGLSTEYEFFIPRWTQVIDISEFSHVYYTGYAARTALSFTSLSPATDITTYYYRIQDGENPELKTIYGKLVGQESHPPEKADVFKANAVYEVYAVSENQIRSGVTVYGAYGRPFLYYNNVDQPSSTSTTLPTLTLDRSNIVYERNTAKAKVKATLSGSINRNFTYIINAKKKNVEKGLSSFVVSSEIIMELDNGYEYEINLSALDSNGVKSSSSSVAQTLTLNTTDNIPPVLNIGHSQTEANVIKFRFHEDGYTYKLCDLDATRSEKNTIQNVEYYFVPDYLKIDTILDAIKSNCVKTGKVKIDYSKDFFEISNVGLTNDVSYNLYIYAEDTSPSKNYMLKSYSYEYHIIDMIPSAESSDSTNLRITNLPEPESSNIRNYVYLHYLNDNTWQGGYIQGSYVNAGSGGDNYCAIAYSAFSPSGKFVKIDVDNYHVARKSYDQYFLAPIYVYPEYYKKKGTVNEIKCRNKGLQPLTNGYQVFCDNPCFVHTMYSSSIIEKSSGMTEAEYAGYWEQRAAETGLQENYENTMFTYTNDNLKDIPDGFYYTTIVHFADGTVLMGEIKQK